MTATDPQIEHHPLQPFLPAGAKLLLLGSFPPPRTRWCMDFFYPNPQNDMWRIMGLLFYGDKLHFVEQTPKPVFRYEAVVAFCRERGIAIFDTAQAVKRLHGNASDEHMEIVLPTDIAALLRQLPDCRDICCTGQKAAATLAETLGCPTPRVGTCTTVVFPLTDGISPARSMRFWRMPSTSRAYPLSLSAKADAYRRMAEEIGLL